MFANCIWTLSISIFSSFIVTYFYIYGMARCILFLMYWFSPLVVSITCNDAESQTRMYNKWIIDVEISCIIYFCIGVMTCLNEGPRKINVEYRITFSNCLWPRPSSRSDTPLGCWSACLRWCSWGRCCREDPEDWRWLLWSRWRRSSLLTREFQELSLSARYRNRAQCAQTDTSYYRTSQTPLARWRTARHHWNTCIGL